MPQNRIIDHEVFKIKRANSDQESMWDDCVFGGGEAHIVSRYKNHFHNYIAGDWTVTETGSGSRAITDEVGGVLLITNGASDDDVNSLQLVGESFLPGVGKRVWVEARIKISDATQSDFCFGLAVTDTTPRATANGIKFQKDDGDTNIDFLVSTGSADSQATAIATLGTAYIRYGFKVTGTGLIEYWIDGIKKGALTITTPTTEMRLTLNIQNGEAVAKTMSIDYIHAVQEL